MLNENIANRVVGPSAVNSTILNPSVDDYAELKRLIQQKGLLSKQPVYYTWKIVLTMSMLALGLIVLVAVREPWIWLADAVWLAFVFNQIAYLGHDLGHRQIFDGERPFRIAGYCFSILLGFSREWWVIKHNRHHNNPNQIDLDPDIDVPVVAFSEEQALGKKGIARLIVRHQAVFFVPLTSLVALSPLNLSIRFLLRREGKHTLAEAACISLHFVLYLGYLFSLTEAWQAALFVVMHQALFGLYMGSVFAPNHKGMPLLAKNSRMDFLHRQILTARNVKAHPLTDFWYGGLNYQIEHHLFPRMPRNKLREAQGIIKSFCQLHEIPYYETGVWQSYKEIFQFLHQVSAPLRETEPNKMRCASGDSTTDSSHL